MKVEGKKVEKKEEKEVEMTFAVYGTLKNGYGNHYLLSDAEFLGEFITPKSYKLFDGGFPIVERGGETAIHCELYRTNSQRTIDRVFQLEGCHKEQDHKDSWYTYDKIVTPKGEAIMFVMNEGTSGRHGVIATGKWGRK